MKTFVVGDSHGANKAMLQVLERAGFDYEKDRLICLGDVADGWPEVPELIEMLLTIKNLVMVRGNHDQWLKDFLKYGQQPDIWVLQGGQASKDAYLNRRPELMQKHREFLQKTPFFFEEEGRLFVHGGYKPGTPLQATDKMYLMWDRQLWDGRNDPQFVKSQYQEVYVGHTSIYRFSHKPIMQKVCGAETWFMDTGGGWNGVLSMMNVDTKEVFQSDVVKDLYPDYRGRN